MKVYLAYAIQVSIQDCAHDVIRPIGICASLQDALRLTETQEFSPNEDIVIDEYELDSVAAPVTVYEGTK